MNDYLNRIYRFKGSPQEIGLAARRALGEKLEHNINHYITRRQDATAMNKLRQGALPWLRHLPRRFQDEYAGMAEGAHLPLQRLAEWAYLEECESNQCSGAVCRLDTDAHSNAIVTAPGCSNSIGHSMALSRGRRTGVRARLPYT